MITNKIMIKLDYLKGTINDVIIFSYYSGNEKLCGYKSYANKLTGAYHYKTMINHKSCFIIKHSNEGSDLIFNYNDVNLIIPITSMCIYYDLDNKEYLLNKNLINYFYNLSECIKYGRLYFAKEFLNDYNFCYTYSLICGVDELPKQYINEQTLSNHINSKKY